MGIRNFFREKPFLAGCAGCLATSVIACGGLAALSGLGVLKIASCAGQGLDSLPGLMRDASAAGFSFATQYINGEVTWSLEPAQPREVTCADLEAIVFPHLTGELETVRIESTSYPAGGGGTLSPVPIDCTYSGFPGRAGQGP